MNILQQFDEVINKQNLFTRNDRLLIAVSGGMDSVVLSELCFLSGYNIQIAHCNFQLRGDESRRDEDFVKTLGKKYGVEVYCRSFNTKVYAEQHKISIQEAARDLRYEWFKLLLESANKDTSRKTYLLTAHHADDNAETVLMNFSRGTGLTGLTGIKEINGLIRRPLLGFTRKQLTEFAHSSNLQWVEDSSNKSSAYTRNYFRNEVMPMIQKVYPGLNESLKDSIERFKDINELYKLSVDQLKKKICKEKGKEIHVPVKQLMAFKNKALIYEIIAPFGFQEKQVDEVIKLASSESGKFINAPSNSYRIIRHRHWFIISPVLAIDSGNIIIDSANMSLDFEAGKLIIEEPAKLEISNSKSNRVACLDKNQVEFPLLLRRWKPGDYFYPLGMKKKKKLARFFIDQKLSKIQKEEVWVLESNKKIIWIVGYRIDERMKVTDHTRKMLRITLNPVGSART